MENLLVPTKFPFYIKPNGSFIAEKKSDLYLTYWICSTKHDKINSNQCKTIAEVEKVLDSSQSTFVEIVGRVKIGSTYYHCSEFRGIDCKNSKESSVLEKRLPGWSNLNNRFYNSRDNHKLKFHFKLFRFLYKDLFEFKISHDYPDMNIQELFKVSNFGKTQMNWDAFSIPYHHPVQQLYFVTEAFKSFRLPTANNSLSDSFNFSDFAAHISKQGQIIHATATSKHTISKFIKRAFTE